MRPPFDHSGVERPQGRYVLCDLLGRGGMAEVFSGYVIGSHGFQKPVAVKRLLAELANDHVFVDRLIREANLLVGMQHGNIVSVLDLARDGDNVFLVMEFVDGPSLGQLLRARGQRRLSLAVSTYIVQSAAAGLEFAHARPGGAVIHADISPSNLLLTTSGEVRVADFGVARREGRMHGVVEGKWAYMAPEQARGEALTPRSDVFALGVVLYELLTGYHPFGQRVTADERDSGPIPIAPTRALNPHVPPGLDAICMCALAHQPRDRYARMQHLIDALMDERFSNGWREGANDLAQAIGEIAKGFSNASGPRTQVTDRPVTLHTQSLISEEHSRPSHPPSSLAASDSFEETLDPTGLVYAAAGPPPPPVRVPGASPVEPTLEPEVLPTPVSQLPMMPPMPSLRPTWSVDADMFRLSPAMLPRPQLAAVHGATAHCHVIQMPRTSKWMYAMFVMATIAAVVAVGIHRGLFSDEADPGDTSDAVSERDATSHTAPPSPTPTPTPTDIATNNNPEPPTQAPTGLPAQPPTAQPEVTTQRPGRAAGDPDHKGVAARSEKTVVTARGSGMATLRVKTFSGSPWAQVMINGETQEAPGARFKLSPGNHLAKLTNSIEHLSLACKFTLAANDVATLRVDLLERICELE